MESKDNTEDNMRIHMESKHNIPDTWWPAGDPAVLPLPPKPPPARTNPTRSPRSTHRPGMAPKRITPNTSVERRISNKTSGGIFNISYVYLVSFLASYPYPKTQFPGSQTRFAIKVCGKVLCKTIK